MQLLAQYGKLSMAKALCPLLSNPNGNDEEKKTPIYLASRHGQLEIIKLLEPLAGNNLTVDAIQFAIDNASKHFDGVKYPHVVKYLESCIVEKSKFDLNLKLNDSIENKWERESLTWKEILYHKGKFWNIHDIELKKGVIIIYEICI